MPMRQEEFTHRNGRTARMNANGAAICIKGKNDRIPEYAKDIKTKKITDGNNIPKSEWKTLLISGGRRDKISKGDIAGLFMKKGNLSSKEIGLIEIKSDCAFVAVCNSKADEICQKLSNHRLKKKKIRIQKI
jgi:superfamily II DNA/RNA helicase